MLKSRLSTRCEFREPPCVRGPSAKVIRAVRIDAGAAAVTRHSPPHERRRMGADQGNARPRSEGPQRITPPTPGLAPSPASRTAQATMPVFVGRTPLPHLLVPKVPLLTWP